MDRSCLLSTYILAPQVLPDDHPAGQYDFVTWPSSTERRPVHPRLVCVAGTLVSFINSFLEQHKDTSQVDRLVRDAAQGRTEAVREWLEKQRDKVGRRRILRRVETGWAVRKRVKRQRDKVGGRRIWRRVEVEGRVGCPKAGRETEG